MTRQRPQNVSWLLLERYALGEFDSAQRLQIKASLEQDPAGRACLAQIETEQRELPALPRLDLPPRATATPDGRLGIRGWRWRFTAPALAAAALALFLLWPRGVERPRAGTPNFSARVAIKGGDLALGLVRQRGDVIIHDPRRFAVGDRFKVLVTSPPGADLAAEIVLLQGGRAYLPLPRAARLPGGNLRPLPGAFSLDGKEPVDVCLVADAQLPARRRLSQSKSPSELPGSVVCQRLLPSALRTGP